MASKVVKSPQLTHIFKSLGNKTSASMIVLPAMTMGAESMMTKAKRLTPVDTGRLRASGRVYRGTITPRVVVMLGFHTSYSIIVHEDLKAHHPVGQAKFLETAVNAGVKNLERQIAAAIQRSSKV